MLNYKFNRRFSISSNFTYSTGRPITYPDAVFIVDGYSVVQFSERNTSRIPDYNRLDLAFILDESLNKTRKWKGSWTLSIYNVYGRKNPYSIFFQPNFKGSLAKPTGYRFWAPYFHRLPIISDFDANKSIILFALLTLLISCIDPFDENRR